jgi:hypothetical protein
MFRDTAVSLAQHEREKADLKTRLQEEESESDELQKKLDEATEKLEKLEKKNKNQFFKAVKEKIDNLLMSPADRRMKEGTPVYDYDPFTGAPKMRPWTAEERKATSSRKFRKLSFGSGSKNPFRSKTRIRGSFVHTMLMSLFFIVFVSVTVYNIYQYFYGIQEGMVYDKSYTPPHTECSSEYDREGRYLGQDCTNYPEEFRIYIRVDEETNNYSVSSGTYVNTQIGEWFCYVDLFHDAANCHGPSTTSSY